VLGVAAIALGIAIGVVIFWMRSRRSA